MKPSFLKKIKASLFTKEIEHSFSEKRWCHTIPKEVSCHKVHETWLCTGLSKFFISIKQYDITVLKIGVYNRAIFSVIVRLSWKYVRQRGIPGYHLWEQSLHSVYALMKFVMRAQATFHLQRIISLSEIIRRFLYCENWRLHFLYKKGKLHFLQKQWCQWYWTFFVLIFVNNLWCGAFPRSASLGMFISFPQVTRFPSYTMNG